MGRAGRAFSVVFGCFLAGVGVYALTLDHAPLWWRVPGGLALVVLGVDLVVAALRDRKSWLSRIGPLP